MRDTQKVAASTFLFFCISLFLTAYSAKNPGVAKIGFTAIAEVQRPFQTVGTDTVSSVAGWFATLSDVWTAQEENQTLKTKVQELEAKNIALLEYESENKRLRSIIGALPPENPGGVFADIIGYDVSGWSKAVVVNRGERDGIRQGMPVVFGDAVVGQVVVTAPGSSKVLLLTDSMSGVDAIVQVASETGARPRGVVEGTGNQDCILSFVFRDETVAAGERVLTSGMDGVFPKGFLVGTIADTSKRGARGLFQYVKVRPAVNFARLEQVFIVTRKAVE